MASEKLDEKAIFNQARKIDSPHARAEFLHRACGADNDLFERVDALLRAYDEQASFLEHPAIENAATQILASVIEDLAGERTGSRTTPEVEDIPLDFLEPAQQPDSLGRLGQYEILEAVGRGGMGIVLKARDTKLHRVVAVKVLAPELAANATARKRFLREAQAAAAVSHEHVVTIYAVEDNERLPYLVMEFIDGQSLQQKIDRQGQLELKEILRIGRQIAAGLEAAHAQGLIHRDVKPSNILLQNGVQRVQITDFGLARAVDDVGMTRTGEVTGTPQYMSPEQAQGHPVDARTDLFSLGSVLYAMCTGRSPFRAETTMASLRRVCDDTPRPIREINPDVPTWLVAIIDRLLQKNPADRIQTAAEVADLLGQHLAHVQDPRSTPFPGSVAPVRRTKRWTAHAHRWMAAGLVLIAVMMTLGVTEATGVTHLSGTVVRIVSGEGTLVIEVDDPSVQVALDGEELRISGAGLQEIKLRPGQYQFQATKNGQPLKTEIVRITRGGRFVVGVTVEHSPLDVTSSEPSLPAISDIFLSQDWRWTLPVNLGAAIHHGNASNPSLSSDGRTLLFASSRPGGEGSWDIWMSTRPDEKNPWSEPINMGPQINSEHEEGTARLTEDRLTLLFESNRPGGEGDWDLWTSTRTAIDQPWSDPVNLGPLVNRPGTERVPHLSRDGLTLVFSSGRPGGLGAADLWMSQRLATDAPWSDPVNLGAPVNSSAIDWAPVLSADGRLLLFCSNRGGKEGWGEIMMSTRASPRDSWSEPVALGDTVNSGNHEFLPTLSADGQTLIFVSSRPGGYGDFNLWMTRRVPSTAGPQNIMEFAAEAVRIAQQGDTDQAARFFSRALDLATQNANDQERLAVCEQVIESDEVFQRLLELRNDDSDLWRERGTIMANRGDWDEAARSYRTCLDLGPQGGGVWLTYALVLLAKGDDRGYRELCTEMFKTFSDNPDPSEQGMVAWAGVMAPIAVEDRQQGLQMAEQAWKASPDQLYLVMLHGAWLHRTGRDEEAIRVLNEAEKLRSQQGRDFNTEIAWCFLAMAYARTGDMQLANTWAQRARDTKLPPSALWIYQIPRDRLIAEMEHVLQTPPGDSPPEEAVPDGTPVPPPKNELND